MPDFSMVEKLCCPVCRSPFGRNADSFFCKSCGTRFPVVEGVPVLLAGRNQDIWKENNSWLAGYFQEHPETAAALKNAPEHTLGGADLPLKAFLLPQQGSEAETLRLWELSFTKNYPEAYRRAFEEQTDFICQSLSSVSEPIVDLASGRGMLLSRFMEKCRAPILASDLSPTTLSSLRRRWAEDAMSGRFGALAFDVKHIPFPDGNLPYLTTCLGLQNIPQPEEAVRELRRVCGGTLFAMCLFFPDSDRENQDAAAQFGLEGAYSKKRLTGLLEKNGWEVTSHDSPEFFLPPTPESDFIKGMRADGLPVAPTIARLSTLVCRAV